MSIDAMKMALIDIAAVCEVLALDAPQEVLAQLRDTHQSLSAAIEAAERQEPVDCQYAKDVGMPEYSCVGKCQYTTPQPAIPPGMVLVTKPRFWSREESDAWHKAIPDIDAAFDAIAAAKEPT